MICFRIGIRWQCLSFFNHNPILLEHCVAFRGPSPFKFEEMWFQVLDFFEVVNLEWNRMCFYGNPVEVLR